MQPRCRDDAEHDRDREQHQRCEAGATIDVPEDRRAQAGHPPTRTTLPSWATSRAATPRPASQRGAASPLTMAAVLAVLAATQLRAATVTVRHGDCTGSPDAGGVAVTR